MHHDKLFLALRTRITDSGVLSLIRQWLKSNSVEPNGVQKSPKGKGYSLKRSRPHERPKDSYLEKLETINVFGIHADYMAKFREYLNEEGITTKMSLLGWGLCVLHPK